MIVFGNGPQVGAELLRSEAAHAEVEPASLATCVAATQGTIGFALELALRTELDAAGLRRSIAGLISLIAVDPADPAFAAPDKPIGPFYPAQRAAQLHAERGWTLVDDAGRGHRRVVPSPRPLALIDDAPLRALFDAGHVVIAGGGGGIPVARDREGHLQAVEAVIDKDHTAVLLGRAIAADTLILLTAVDAVQQGFGRPEARDLARLTPEEARSLAAAGEFPAGSMGPKIAAALEFLSFGERVVISSPARLRDAMAGRAGTWIMQG